MNTAIIENISHTFINGKKPIKVIGDFSITIREKEVVAILGPSGCGKSTILRCIGGFLRPSLGNIEINGKTPSDASINKMIGFAFQEPALMSWKNVKDNIALPGTIGLINNTALQISEQVDYLINLMDLKEFEDYYPYQLSGGMKQRVALARALLLKPSLLLLDEPFGSLDLLTRTNLIIELGSILKKTITPTIIVTHSIEEAVFLADKICILSQRPSKIVEEMNVNFGKERDSSLFDNPEFLRVVANCRKILLNHWNKYE